MRLILVVLFLAGTSPAHAGKLDLDIYTTLTPPAVTQQRLPQDHWTPGDPRDLRGQSKAIRHLSHVGYASMAIAGLIGCAATGLVAPAVGFGIVTLVHLWGEWRTIAPPPRTAN